MMQEIINQFPVTTDIQVREEHARLGYTMTEDGYEWYAVFAEENGELIQLTDWEGFENCWESYNGLFCEDCSPISMNLFQSLFARILEVLQ